MNSRIGASKVHMLTLLQEAHLKNKMGIFFMITQDQVDEVHSYLAENAIKSFRYHLGIENNS